MLFIFGCAGSSWPHRLFPWLCHAGSPLVVVGELCTAVAPRAVEPGLRSARASVAAPLGSRAQAPQLWPRGLVAPRHVGSSWIGDRTPVSCIGSRFFTTEPPGKPWDILIFLEPAQYQTCSPQKKITSHIFKYLWIKWYTVWRSPAKSSSGGRRVYVGVAMREDEPRADNAWS